MAKGRRNKRTYRLPNNHGWKAGPGNAIFVADRGAMQFEYPKDWILSPSAGGSIRFFDQEEADADIRLEASLIYVQPIDWTGLPLPKLIDDVAVSDDPRGLTKQGPYHEMRRANLEAAWLEVEFTDPDEDRKAHSRICLSRGPGVYAFITMDFWPEDASRAYAVWDNVLNTLKLDQRNQDRLTLSGHEQPPRPGKN